MHSRPCDRLAPATGIINALLLSALPWAALVTALRWVLE